MHGRVTTTQWLTPGLVRLTLGEGDLEGFAMPEATDAYVNVAVPPLDAPYDAVFDPAQVRADFPSTPGRRAVDTRCARGTRCLAPWSSTSWCTDSHGVAGTVGGGRRSRESVLVFEGPGGGYRPDPAADWHLLVGDESALPAIAASLEALPARAPSPSSGSLCDGPDHRAAAALVRAGST